MRQIMAVALLIATGLAAGCATQDERPPPTTPGPETTAPPLPIAFDVLEERFDHADELPDGWDADTGEWRVARDASAPSPPNVLRGSTADTSASWIRAPARFAEFDATLLFRIMSGDGGAGLVFGHAEGEHYRVLYSPGESAWRLVSFREGQESVLKESKASTQVTPDASAEWISLRVQLEGARLQAWHDSQMVLDVEDLGEPRAGELGVFLGPGTAATIDDLRIEPLTR